jgi:hypothetical protein
VGHQRYRIHAFPLPKPRLTEVSKGVSGLLNVPEGHCAIRRFISNNPSG